MRGPHGAFTADQPQKIAEALFGSKRRILVMGESGTGKSTLVGGLSECLKSDGVHHQILIADPGSPAVGVPGALCLGQFENGTFNRSDYEALCSLNAGRFRLPLMEAVIRLTADLKDPLLLIDGPGLTRGTAATELLSALITATNADALLWILRSATPLPLAANWKAAAINVLPVLAASRATALNDQQRKRLRTALWDAHIAGFPPQAIKLSTRPLLGTPPPMADLRQWCGRQVALIDGQRTIAMGEVVYAQADHLMAKLPAIPAGSTPLLVRDAGRNAKGELVTVTPPQRPFPLRRMWPAGAASHAQEKSPAVSVNLGVLTVTLVNGIFGDPLLHLRLSNQKRSLLFDIGEGSRLPARIAHQISDVFITHAHLDHIGGFYWLLRARIGELPPCGLHGPAGLSSHIRGMIDGILWDRIGNRGPCFDVVELEGHRIVRQSLKVGLTDTPARTWETPFDGLLVDDPTFTIHATILDHGIPVLALAYEEKPHSHVIEAALHKTGYPPGPWLGELKRRVAAGAYDAAVLLPDGSSRPVAELAGDLIRITPGRKLVYATDVADSAANRHKLIGLARGADLFFCEAAYADDHRHLAATNGHLTARACGEIAAAAGVRRLIPFHLSRRYERHPEQVFNAIMQTCQGVQVTTAVDRSAT